MKINTFKYFFLDAVKGLKRNVTITVFLINTVAATFFIAGLILLYLLSVKKNSPTIFRGFQEMDTVLRWLEVAVFIVLPPVLLFLIVNAIKMTMFPRKNEISIMKLIGATDWFIRWPFIIQGLIIGIIGAFIGSLALFFVYSLIYSKAMDFTAEIILVQPAFVTNTMLWQFGISGAFIGPIGSIIALRKVLKCTVWEIEEYS